MILMSIEEFILALKICFLNVGLNPVVMSPIRLAVLFRGICEGFRIGWVVVKGGLPIEA